MQLNQVTTDHKRHVIVIRKQITTSSSITHPIMNTIVILLILTAGTAQAEWQLADKPNQRPDCSFIGNATFDGDMPFEANCKAACDFAHGCNAAHGHEPVQTHEHTCQLLECDDLQNIQWIDVFSFTPRQTWLKDNSQPVDDLAVMALEPLQFHFINITRYVDVVRYYNETVVNTRYKTKHRYVNKGGCESMCTMYDPLVGGLVLVLAICLTIIMWLVRKRKKTQTQQIHVLYDTNNH